MSTAPPISAARYSAPVWARFCHPTFAGAPDEAAVTACVEDAAHHLRLCLHYVPGAVRFTVIGCPTTIALADFCAERLSEGVVPDGQAMVDALEIDASHRHCVLLCEDTINAVLDMAGPAGAFIRSTP
ncbi:hypothetical protein [Algiphilus sp.]|uniref:hypothetical protein n=1 Tax=Algiphilus sp. TaxID=1872431 RepID=UPI0032EE12F3